MSRTIFCTFLQREAEGQDFQLYPGELENASITRSPKKPGAVAAQANHAD